MKMREESEKVGLRLNIQKTKIMASGPITSWQIDGEKVTDFSFLCSKIIVDGYCSHKIKRCLLLGRKDMINLDSVLKSRDIILPAKVCLVKAMIFPIVMYGWASQVALVVKKKTRLLMQETQETWVQSVGWEDPLEKGIATYSSILAWRTPWTIQSMDFSRSEYWSG